MIAVFIPTYHNITCICVPTVRRLGCSQPACVVSALGFHAQITHIPLLSSVSSLCQDWFTASGLEFQAAVRHEIFKDALESGVRRVGKCAFAVDGLNDAGVL